MKKMHKDLQPWLDYFVMLRRYQQNGFLQPEPLRGEAYVTRAALFTLVPHFDITDRLRVGEAMSKLQDVTARIRAYCGWLSQDGTGYLDRPFALHVVDEDEPHDLHLTLLLTRVRRRWYCPWRKQDKFEVIPYDEPKPKEP